MSEKIRPEDAVRDALELESQLARSLEETSDDRARREVREKMERWMGLMEDPRVAKTYSEQLGDLDPSLARQDMLSQISGRFPNVAKTLGWDASASSVDQAA